MTVTIDKKAQTQWGKSSISYENYQNYINLKQDRYKLSLIDLLYVSNFKGGNATINEPESVIENKLNSYSTGLKDIHNEFNKKTLAELTNMELENLVSKIMAICNLTRKDTNTRIDGFSVSYLSALLNVYSPTLIPILDRRVLINLHLVSNNDIDKQGQIKNIQQFYKPLIEKIAKISRDTNLTVREVDRQIFITKIEKQFPITIEK